ncbi:hypothetical protein [Aphanothece sacrum]|uniref:hypothetical protein n=1 Tax=Aphanothece sacrum TaxID=1122 RepID=UPI001D130D24|nr:hypothetical protein [Aphanothece sacrum]
MMGIGYILSWGIYSIGRLWFGIVTILTRLFLLFMYPGDDIWRYLWEGYLQTQGISPYNFSPNAIELLPYRTSWWLLINHLDVSAIYPPVAQWGFRFLATFGANVIIFKLGFVGADLLVCWLLYHRFGKIKSLIYAWNPLVIYSFSGGGHYDSWFILPLVGSWFIFDNIKSQDNTQIRKWILSSLLLGISIGIKWISLPILGFLVWQAFRRINLKLALLVLITGLFPLSISVLPFCTFGKCPLIPTSSTFVSHGRSAELFPYLLALVWQGSRQSNWIYALFLIAAIAFSLIKFNTFQSFNQGYFFFLLTLSPIIHAWYFTWIIPFSVGNQNLGVRLISLSAFVYFILQYRMALGDSSWVLIDRERLLLWLPFLLGYLWTIWYNINRKNIA